MTKLSSLTEARTFGIDCALVSAENATLVLREPGGRTWEATDLMSAYASVNFGHRNPAIDPFADASADIAACFCPEEARTVAEWLCARLDLDDHRVLYQVGGSFAVSTALALAQGARPGRILTVDGGFHGLGADALAASRSHGNMAIQQTALTDRLAPLVDTVRDGEMPTSWDGISCFLFEPVQGANGYVPLSMSWLREMEAEARCHGVVTIADEIQCGFFRHGSLSPSRVAGLRPDILLYSKSLTNGLFPLSAVVYDIKLERHQPYGAARLAHTFQTSALGYYAADAVIRYVDSVDVAALASSVNELLSRLEEDLLATGAVSNIYRSGPTLSYHLGPASVRELVRRCVQRGVLLLPGGADGSRIRIAPPLTIPPAQLLGAMSVVADIVSEFSVADIDVRTSAGQR